MADVPPVHELVDRATRGDKPALEALMPMVYAELRRLAAHYLKGERPGQTLQPTALVHEAYLKLLKDRPERWQNRAHFCAIAAHAMRQVLIELRYFGGLSIEETAEAMGTSPATVKRHWAVARAWLAKELETPA